MLLYCICIKLCGLIQLVDVDYVVELGVDVIGLVFYLFSLCYVVIECVVELVCCVGLFVIVMGLFVNVSVDDVVCVLDKVLFMLFQFYGDELVELCVEIVVKVWLLWLCVLCVQFGVDLVEFGNWFVVV